MRAVLCFVAAFWVSVFAQLPASTQAAAIPDRLTDAEFWQLATSLEEKGGAFHSDNFTSNEPGFAETAAALSKMFKGGAYLGVGPEQNFSYIVATRPAIAFIVDIRRQAIVQHLIFKALFEMSADRADFITRLFSRERPPGLESASIQDIWNAVPAGPGTDRERYLKNRAAIEHHLTNVRGIPLTSEERASLDYVYNAFFRLGPDINYAGYQTKLTTGNVNFAKLSLTADSAGVLRSFLGSEENFKLIKSMQERNLIVPVEADIAGPRAVRGIGDYVRARNAKVTAFYISNVEQYLFGRSVAKETDINGGSKGFYDNLATLPMESTSVLVRGYGPRFPAVCRVADFLKAVAAGRVQSLGQAQQCGGA